MDNPDLDNLVEKRARRILLLSIVATHTGLMSLWPILAPLGREMALSEFQITSIIAASSMTMFLASPYWGRLSDRWGRKRVMLIGILGFSIGTVIFNTLLHAGLAGLLVGIPLYLTLIVARVGVAGVMCAFMPSSTAYMADITSPADRTKGMGAAGAATNLGTILGPSLAVLAFISLVAPLWIVAFVALVNGLFVWRYLPVVKDQAQEPGAGGLAPVERMPYTDRRILPFVFVGVLLFVGTALVQQTMGFRFQDAIGLSATDTATTVGVAMMLSAMCALFAQGFIVQRFNLAPFTLLKLALPLAAVAFGMMAFFETRWMLTFAMMIQGFGMGLATPGFTAGASLAVSAREQGAVAGVIAACMPLGFTIGPLVGGILYEIGPVLPYAFAAVMYVLLIPVMQTLEGRVIVHREE